MLRIQLFNQLHHLLEALLKGLLAIWAVGLTVAMLLGLLWLARIALGGS